MNTRERVLKEALKCVNGEREKQYGNPEDNFRRIADLWSTYLTSLFEDENVVIDIDPIDVAKMMILFKIARSNGDKDKMDNYVDMIGYASCGAELLEKENEKATWPKDIEEASQMLKEELDNDILKNLDVADECKGCDYAAKCVGTGVCLKETEEKCLKNGESILDNFADHINARVRKKTEEKCLHKPDNKYDYWRAHSNICDHILRSSSKASVNPFDVMDQLIRNGHASKEMAVLLVDGTLNFDDVASYVEDAINELKKDKK